LFFKNNSQGKGQVMPPQLCKAVQEMITAKWQKQLAKVRLEWIVAVVAEVG
jgi:hypothetical protein